MRTVLVPGLSAGIKRSDSSKSSMSLGILSLASTLYVNNYDVRIVSLDDLIRKGELSIYNDFNRVAADILLSYEAKVYGFYVAVGLLHYVVEISRYIKRERSDTMIILGGPHATAIHKKILEYFSYIDIIVRGEGEITFLKLIEAVRNGENFNTISGITVNGSSGIHVNPDARILDDMDSLVRPVYELYPKEPTDRDIFSLDVGRGCPYNCQFCSTSMFWQRISRIKSSKRIVEEMKSLIRKKEAKKIFLMHDCLTSQRTQILEMCNLLNQSSLGVEWGCAAHLDHLEDDEFLSNLKESGCTHLEIGIESGSKKIREKINKTLGNNKEIIEKLKKINEYGFSLVLYFMCGFAEEDKEDIEDTLALIGKSATMLQGNGFFRLSPLEVFTGARVLDIWKDNIIFNFNRVSEELLQSYPKRILEVAKKEPSLFPEFYYVPNNNNIPFKYFLDLGSLYSHVIRLLTLQFPYLCDFLTKAIPAKVKEIAFLWKDYEATINQCIRKPEVIIEEIDGFLDYLKKIGKISNLVFVKDLYRYERMVHKSRQLFLSSSESKARIDFPQLNDSLVILDLSYDIPNIIPQIKNIGNADLIEESQIIVAAYAITAERVRIIKINGIVREIIRRINRRKKISDLKDEICHMTNSSDDRNIVDIQFESAITKLVDLGIVKL